MLLWTLIIVPILTLTAAILWLRPKPPPELRPSGDPEESHLLRLLDLFEAELRQSEGECRVVGPSSDAKALILSFDHQESVLSLPDLLRFAKVRGHQLHELVQELVEYLQENQSGVEDLPFDLAIADLLPQIRTMEWIEANSPAFGAARLLRSPLLDDLRICYVIDEAETMVFLTEAHLAAWGASLDAVHNLAMENLGKIDVERVPRASEGSENEALRIIEEGDGYSATRLLLLIYASEPPATQVFGIPERDKLYVGSASDLCDGWRKQLAEDYFSGRYPLASGFFRIQDQRLVSLDS